MEHVGLVAGKAHNFVWYLELAKAEWTFHPFFLLTPSDLSILNSEQESLGFVNVVSLLEAFTA